VLAELGASTFAATFASENTPADMASYLAESFGEEIQRAELEHPDVTVFVAERGKDTVGYVMLREAPAPPALEGFDVLEIARLYVREHVKGAGVGRVLMQRAIHEAALRGKEALWLGVWERNARAREFYRRWEFFEAGAQSFKLGDDLQNDIVMVRRIARES
jgi:GNAT superfamily N-acetyltransferase